MPRTATQSLSLRDLQSEGNPDGTESLMLITDNGQIRARCHAATGGTKSVLWLFGAGGGLGGPAGGIYYRLARQLVRNGVASLELDYRHPGDLIDCTLDALLGIELLADRGHPDVMLAGHSFGGAVVIRTAVASERVIGVVAMSSQSYGAEGVGRISPRPVLFIHGENDEVLPDTCSRSLY